MNKKTDMNFTDKQIKNICLNYRHDFGLMNESARQQLQAECKQWIIAIQKEFPENVEKEQFAIPDFSVSVAEVRQAFADYYKSEGCSCCQNTEAHGKAEQKLAELLQPDQYDYESGFNWYKYATER